MASPQEYETPVPQQSATATNRDRVRQHDGLGMPHVYQVLEPQPAEGTPRVYTTAGDALQSLREDSGMYTSISPSTNSTRISGIGISQRTDTLNQRRLSQLPSHDYRHPCDATDKSGPSDKESNGRYKLCRVVLICSGVLALILAMSMAVAALSLVLLRTSTCQCTDGVSERLSRLLEMTSENSNRLSQVDDLIASYEDKLEKASQDIYTIMQALEEIDKVTIQINDTFTKSIQSLENTVQDLSSQLEGGMFKTNCTTLLEDECTILPEQAMCTTRYVPYQNQDKMTIDITCKSLGGGGEGEEEGEEGSGGSKLMMRAIVTGNTVACQCNSTQTPLEDNAPTSLRCGICITRC